MEKLTDNIHYGCLFKYQRESPCGFQYTVEAPSNQYMRCDMHKIVARLREYEALNMTPEEISRVLKDGEEIADSCIKYKNRCVELEHVMELRNWAMLLEKAKKYDELERENSELKASKSCLEQIVHLQSKINYDLLTEIINNPLEGGTEHEETLVDSINPCCSCPNCRLQSSERDKNQCKDSDSGSL